MVSAAGPCERVCLFYHVFIEKKGRVSVSMDVIVIIYTATAPRSVIIMLQNIYIHTGHYENVYV